MPAWDTMTDRAALSELGQRLAQHRLTRNLTQAELAAEAGVSRRTVLRLEGGESTQLTHLIRVLRALHLLGSLETWIPAPVASPLEQLRLQQQKRRRASRRVREPSTTKAQGWTWGDDEERSR